MSDFESHLDPPSNAGIRDALENQAVEVRRWATRQIEEVEQHRDEQLQRIDGALACVQGERSRSPRRLSPRPGARPSRSQRKAAPTNPAAVRERCEAVSRLLIEVGRPLSPKEIREMLNLTPHTVHTALKRLTREGRVKRTGNGPTARYAAKGGGPQNGTGAKLPKPTPGGSDGGTLEGRVIATLQDRGYASAEELGQALGEPVDRVLEACAALQAEEEIRMDRRDGKPVYVSGPAA